MDYLRNQYIWASALAWLIFFGAAARYIACATRLSQYIDANCPDFWQKIAWGNTSSSYNLIDRGQARGLEWLVLFNRAAKYHPNDPEFRRLLSDARWPAAIFLLALIAGIVLLGRADNDLHRPNAGNLSFQQSDRR